MRLSRAKRRFSRNVSTALLNRYQPTAAVNIELRLSHINLITSYKIACNMEGLTRSVKHYLQACLCNFQNQFCRKQLTFNLLNLAIQPLALFVSEMGVDLDSQWRYLKPFYFVPFHLIKMFHNQQPSYSDPCPAE